MAEMKISNTLVNDTSDKTIAYAEQLKQQIINWAEYNHVTEKLGPNNRPNTQNLLNNLFLRVYEEFLTFLNNADATDQAINTWKEIEAFLAGYTDDKTLASIVAQLNANIESRLNVQLADETGDSTTTTMTQKAITEAIDNVALGAVYDVSAKNPTAGPNNDGKFESLSALLSDTNLNTLIPTAVRKGGMSIKFIQSSDNKYVRYNLIADEFTTDVTQWAIDDVGVYIENPEFVYVKTDKDNKILWAIKTDGGIYYGAGVPQQVKDYIEEKLAGFSPDEYEDIVAFLSDYLGSDTTLKAMIDGINAQIATKVDKVEGKSLIDAEYAASQSVVENPEYMQVEVDVEDKILGGRKANGTKFENLPVELQGVRHEVVDNPEWIEVKTDSEGKILEGLRTNGKKVIGDLEGLDDKIASKSLSKFPFLDTQFTTGVHSYEIKLKKNYCNTSGTDTIFELSGSPNYRLNIVYSPPTNELFYQKENWWREDNIYQADFPMAKMNTRLELLNLQSNSIVGQWNLDDTPLTYRSLLKQQPPMMITFNCPEGQESNYTNLRLYITATDGICDTITIKDGDTVIYTKSFTADSTVYQLYAALKEDLVDVSGYSFTVGFTDIENLTITDMVVTKAAGIPFITQFSDNYLTSGTIVYDTYPVFIEFQDNRTYKLDIAYKEQKLNLYIDNTWLSSGTIFGSVSSISFGDNIEVLSTKRLDAYSYNCESLIHGYTAHALANVPNGVTVPESLTTPVGGLTYLADQARNENYYNMSVEEIGLAFIRRETLPNKVFFVELDDFGGLNGFKSMLSNTDEDGMRVMEILKSTGIKIGFAQEFSRDTTLFNKIKNGTATQEEQNTLCSTLTNDEVKRMRAMMRGYGWTVSIHTFIGITEIVTKKYSVVKEAIRNTISWYERMYEKAPVSYTVSGTGYSSPYFRRILSTLGIPVLLNDYRIYSNGYFYPCISRVSFITVPYLPNKDYNKN